MSKRTPPTHAETKAFRAALPLLRAVAGAGSTAALAAHLSRQLAR